MYLDCSSGISGDMTAGALLGLGAEEKVLREALDSLPLEGVEAVISAKYENSILQYDFDVVIDEAVKRPERNLATVLELLRNMRASDGAKNMAAKIFGIAADAQAKAHGIPLECACFHEPGAVDSIVDIVAAAVLLDNLNVAEVALSPIADGSGQICYRHGYLPVPVPAVKVIAEQYQLPLYSTEIVGEMVTPTGASIAAGIRTITELPPLMKVVRSGYGLGKRKYKGGGNLGAHLLQELQ